MLNEGIQDYKIEGIEQTIEYLEYEAQTFDGHIEYGIITDTFEEKEYPVRVDHNEKTITVLEKSVIL